MDQSAIVRLLGGTSDQTKEDMSTMTKKHFKALALEAGRRVREKRQRERAYQGLDPKFNAALAAAWGQK